MGDAINANVPALAAISSTLQLVAGYVTGTSDIEWTAADWALFPGIPHVTIDQAYGASPNLSATVRDVETGAWQPTAAVNQAGWNTARPTIYCNQSTLPSVLANGWQGDLWLAIPGWQPGQALPAAPGCTVVAVQNQQDVSSAYDLSIVLDPYWPWKGQNMIILSVTDSSGITTTYLYSAGQLPQHIVSGVDQSAFAAVLPVVPISEAQYALLAGQT